jgi:hypothetical protein
MKEVRAGPIRGSGDAPPQLDALQPRGNYKRSPEERLPLRKRGHWVLDMSRISSTAPLPRRQQGGLRIGGC